MHRVMFSRTAVVGLEDGGSAQRQRDTTKAALAHSIFGDVVPLVQAAPTTKAYPTSHHLFQVGRQKPNRYARCECGGTDRKALEEVLPRFRQSRHT